MDSTQVEAAPIAVPESVLAALRARLSLTRWPEKEPVNDWAQGAPLAKVQALCDYWRDSYDWRRCEREPGRLAPLRTFCLLVPMLRLQLP